MADTTITVVESDRVRKPPNRVIYPVIAAISTTAISSVAMARPSFWSDEAATISGSTRTTGELLDLVHTLDAVHGLYYLLMGLWFDVVPATEVWARLPGLLAVGAAAAGLVVLVTQLSDRRTGLIAGLTLGLIPQITWAAIEARSYSFTVLIAIGMNIAFVGAVRGASRRRWFAYSILVIAGGLLFVYTVLLVPVHAIMLWVLDTTRSTRIRFLAAAGSALVLLAPFVWVVSGQAGQVDWIADLGFPSPRDIVTQSFDHSLLFALVTAGFILSAVVGGHEPLRRWASNTHRRLWIFAAAWIVVPTALILAFSAVSEPIYLDKYLSFTAPGFAIALALSITNLTRHTLGVIVCICVIASATVPTYVDQRAAHAKLGMDFSDVADLLDSEAQPGDCLLLDDTVTWKPGPIRAMTASRPDVFGALVDVGLGKRAVDIGKMWDQNLAPHRVRDRLAGCDVIWTVSQRDPALTDHEAGNALPPGRLFARHPAFFVPARLGFRLVERWQFNQSQVIRAIR